MFFIFQKNCCLNYNDRGRGKKRLKMSQLKMSQLGLRRERVKLIETVSQNLQFFFWQASLNEHKGKLLNMLTCGQYRVVKMGKSITWP